MASRILSDLHIRATRTGSHVKRMVRILEEAQARASGEPLAETREALQVGKSIACALKEEHGDADFEQVLGSFARRLAGRM